MCSLSLLLIVENKISIYLQNSTSTVKHLRWWGEAAVKIRDVESYHGISFNMNLVIIVQYIYQVWEI